MLEEKFSEARTRMLEDQLQARGIRDPRVLAAMQTVPRQCFVLPEDAGRAYSDGPLPIGYGQTISQPYIVACMAELAKIAPSDRVLEVGGGSGYGAAVLACLAAEVHSMELVPALAERARKSLSDLGYTRVTVHTGDGSDGWLEAAPYQAILVAAAAPKVPQPLLEQLADGGRLILPVGGQGFQRLEVWERCGQTFDRQVQLPVSFVPLRGKFGWK